MSEQFKAVGEYVLEKEKEKAYQQGRADALDHCEKCETDQWDALYKAEMKGKIKGIDECIRAIEESKSLFDNHHHSTMAEKDKMINLLKGLKEQKND